MPSDDISRQTLHASCVALGNFAVLIRGASGAGKSALALELMAYGAMLIADDQTILRHSDQGVIVECPPSIRGRIEARGVGILAATGRARAILRLVADLDGCEQDRLPPRREIDVLGCTIPLLYPTPNAHFAPAILQYLKGGRCD
jgi:HPr kinase/phosphorylase